MLIRFYESAIDGLLSIDGYVDAQSRSPREIAELSLARLSAILPKRAQRRD